MAKYKLVQDDIFQIIHDLKNTKTIDLTLIPKNPMVKFYDNEGHCFHESDCENDFYAIRVMISANDLKGYYFTVETEWWDENHKYQGNGTTRNYKKYFFNVDEEHALSEMPIDLFNFPFDAICAINQLPKGTKTE